MSEVKSKEDVRANFMGETKQNWKTIPAGTGRMQYPSWRYMEWLEKQLILAYKNQFPQEVSDEEIWSEATAWAIKTAMRDDDTLLEHRREAFVEGMKSMRSKLTGK